MNKHFKKKRKQRHIKDKIIHLSFWEKAHKPMPKKCLVIFNFVVVTI